MGFAYSGTCYATEAEAQHAQCVSAFPRVAVEAGEVVNVACVAPVGTTLELARFASGASAPAATTEYVGVSYAECNENAFQYAAPSAAGFVEVWGYAFVGVVSCFLFGLAVRQPLAMLKGR